MTECHLNEVKRKETMTHIKLAIPRGAKIGPDAKPIYGHSTVDAVVRDGLAVHKALKGNRWKYMVTHVASGLALDRIGAMTRKAALDHMERALALPIDWTKGEAETIATLRKDRRIMDGINAIANHN